ncbi:MAG: ArnT family glycosyltransferase [Weeksellaceae bacterium]
MNIKQFLHARFLIFFYLICYFFILAPKLIHEPTPFYDWDESIYVQLGRSMVTDGTFVPQWQGMNWLDKPQLVPLFYGLVIKLTPFTTPEVSTRVASLLLAIGALYLVYRLFEKVTKEPFLPLLAVIITSFTPIFLQRSQVANTDVFVLLGWVGYLIFFQRKYLSVFFLALAVFSKSLLGFFPIGVMGLYYTYRLITKDIKKAEYQAILKRLVIHASLFLSWYLVMLIIYGQDFWIQHIVESHTKRVTASIESHFGKRTYYIDLMFEQFGRYAGLSFASVVIILYQWWKKQLDNSQLLAALFLFPWFIFLNLTKTKIFWYSYPVIPLFAFLMIYPLSLLKRYHTLMYLAIAIIMFSFLNNQLIEKKTHLAQYSKPEAHHRLAIYATPRCEKMYLLVDKTTRDTLSTLESMDLLISTSRWWGSHPSMMFYFNKPIELSYDPENFTETLKTLPKKSCAVTETLEAETTTATGFTLLKKFDTLSLYQKR